MKEEIDICEQTLFSKLIKKFIKIVLFATLYIITTIIMQKLFNYNNSIGIALIILGILGFIYTLFILFHKKLWSLLYTKIDINITGYCIGKTRSMNYGEIIYFPYIEYLYTCHQKEYKSSNVYWDFESCYKTQWTQSDTSNDDDIVLAREKVKLLIELKEAYVFKLLPSIAYLNINLSKKRTIYFLLMNILTFIIFFIGIYLLQKG